MCVCVCVCVCVHCLQMASCFPTKLLGILWPVFTIGATVGATIATCYQLASGALTGLCCAWLCTLAFPPRFGSLSFLMITITFVLGYARVVRFAPLASLACRKTESTLD